MDTQSIIQRLKEIRAASNCRPVIATENDLSRLIASIEKDEKELDDEWDALMRGETLVSHSLEVKYIKAP